MLSTTTSRKRPINPTKGSTYLAVVCPADSTYGVIRQAQAKVDHRDPNMVSIGYGAQAFEAVVLNRGTKLEMVRYLIEQEHAPNIFSDDESTRRIINRYFDDEDDFQPICTDRSTNSREAYAGDEDESSDEESKRFNSLLKKPF